MGNNIREVTSICLHQIKEVNTNHFNELKLHAKILKKNLKAMGDKVKKNDTFVFKQYFKSESQYLSLIDFLDRLNRNDDLKNNYNSEIDDGINALSFFKRRWETDNKGEKLYQAYKSYFDQ